MADPIALSYVIPAFNEEEIIGETLERFTSDFRDLSDVIGDYEIIVVDDGSRDRTASVVREFVEKDPRIRLIRHDRNRGAGEAIRTGLASSRMEWFSVNCADRPFEASDIRSFASDFRDHDLIIACRTDRNAHNPYRKLMSWGNYRLIRWVFSTPIRDFQFVQFYRRALLEGMALVSRGTLVPPEMILRCLRRGARFKEVFLPFRKRPGGTAKYGHPKHIVIALAEMARLKLDFRKKEANRPQTRIEIGTVGDPPTENQLRTSPVPKTVIMNLAKVCNLWCKHCYYPGITSKNAGKAREKFLPEAAFRSVVEELASWDNEPVLRVAADGEPLLNPQCLDMIAYAKKQGVTTALTTNGLLLTPAAVEKLLEAQVDIVDISLDAATSEGYRKVRPNRAGASLYRTVEDNVRSLIEERNRKTPRPRTKVMVNMIDQPSVRGEVSLFQKQWAEWGADVVLIRPFHSTSSFTAQEGVVTAAPGTKRFPCKYPFTRLNVGFDNGGHVVVYYCSHDWEEKTVVGGLGVDGSLRDIWNGAKMREIRRRHLENDFPADSFCGPCPDWYLGWGKSHHELVNKLK